MSVFYLVIKLYPLFGLAAAILCLDLARTYRRKANSVWIGFAMFCVIFLISVGAWVYFRGDLNSERWFSSWTEQFR